MACGEGNEIAQCTIKQRRFEISGQKLDIQLIFGVVMYGTVVYTTLSTTTHLERAPMR